MFGIVYTNVRTKYFIIMTKNMKNTETSIPIRKSPFINKNFVYIFFLRRKIAISRGFV